jgi:glycosyltransferase involved in cell wall biosynthesis
MKPGLTLCMMVKNEAHQLSRCLNSVASLAPELVIVDTGSTDGTPQMAADFGARVLPFDFGFVDFSAARNAGLDCAETAWILVLDADEVIQPESLPLVSRVVQGDENAGYFLKRQNHASDSPTVTTDHVVRLFPNRRDYRYRGRVHETIDDSIVLCGGRLVESEICIRHDFVSSREVRRKKNYWYIEILKEELAANPLDDSRLDFLAAEYHQLEMYVEATAVAERIVELRPRDARAHLFAGTYHLLFKPDFRQARIDFNNALKLRPGYQEAESFLSSLDSKEAAGGSQSSTLLPSAS